MKDGAIVVTKSRNSQQSNGQIRRSVGRDGLMSTAAWQDTGKPNVPSWIVSSSCTNLLLIILTNCSVSYGLFRADRYKQSMHPTGTTTNLYLT